ncbi:DMT family transporter [Sneathiella aquimaris]|uniref:DMT family transporter n=1 Tax=Sneathiella aquimaris TaxID=2599305 RepID=UPI00146C8A96|nr:DMT family transporter [Sneathiella aquimaris]
MTANSPDAAHSGSKLISENPAILLLVTGILVGLNFPLGKIGGEAGVSPMLWAMLVSLGVCLILFPVLGLKKRLAWPRGRMIRYVVISAVISFIIPNLLLFSVIPHAGSGYTGLMFALSPVFTLSLATVFRLRTPGKIGLMGIAVGLVGASIVSVTRGSAPEAPPVMWLLAALAIPMTLACGNIYRTMDWPDGALPDTLAFWSHLFSVVVFLVLMVAVDGTVSVDELALSPWAAFAQLVVGGLTFPVFFRLQQKGGPVLLSQLGYVAAAVGLIAATLLLGESYAFLTWVGAAVIALGIATTVVAQMKE